MKTLARSLLAALVLRASVAFRDVAERLDSIKPVEPEEDAPTPIQDPLTPEAEGLLYRPAVTNAEPSDSAPPAVLRRNIRRVS